MSDIQKTEAALAKVVAWAEAHPDLSWKEGVKNALDTLTEEMATLERELNEARAERDSLDSITNRLTTETRELCELFRKATGYTVDEYTAMRRMPSGNIGPKARAKRKAARASRRYNLRRSA